MHDSADVPQATSPTGTETRCLNVQPVTPLRAHAAGRLRKKSPKRVKRPNPARARGESRRSRANAERRWTAGGRDNRGGSTTQAHGGGRSICPVPLHGTGCHATTRHRGRCCTARARSGSCLMFRRVVPGREPLWNTLGGGGGSAGATHALRPVLPRLAHMFCNAGLLIWELDPAECSRLTENVFPGRRRAVQVRLLRARPDKPLTSP